jgi:hypothetical protein
VLSCFYDLFVHALVFGFGVSALIWGDANNGKVVCSSTLASSFCASCTCFGLVCIPFSALYCKFKLSSLYFCSEFGRFSYLLSASVLYILMMEQGFGFGLQLSRYLISHVVAKVPVTPTLVFF